MLVVGVNYADDIYLRHEKGEAQKILALLVVFSPWREGNLWSGRRSGGCMKRAAPDGPEPLVCGKVGKISALLPHTQLPPTTPADWNTKHDRQENEDGQRRRMGLGLGFSSPNVPALLGFDPVASPAPTAELRKRPLSFETSTEKHGSTENMLPERKRRYQGAQRPSPHPSAWW